MKKDQLFAKLDEFSERVLKLFNGWRESVRATGNKKVLKKIDWLKKFHTYMRRQILNLERSGKLKEPILPDSMARLSRANFKDRYEYMYKRVGLYARPDKFTKTLLELFEDWRVFFKSTEHKEILKEILEDSGYLECFCRFVEAHLHRLKKKGKLKGRLELRIKLAERLKKERASIARIVKEDKLRERLVEFFEDWKESAKATGDIFQRFFRLSEQECCIIRWHMAGFDISPYGRPAHQRAVEMYPTCIALHTADYESAAFLENKDETDNNGGSVGGIKMCGTDYELMAAMEEMEGEIEGKLLSLLKDWKEYICIADKTKRTIAEWRNLFYSYVKEQLADFEKKGKLNDLLEE